MKTEYKIINLDCANCAKKLEKAFQKHPDVESAQLTFMTQKLIIESKLINKELKSILEEIISRVEPDAEIEEL